MTTIDHVDERVIRIVGELSPLGKAEPALADRMMEDLGYDSMAVVELALVLEQEFELKPIDEEQAIDIVTVGDVAELIRSMRAQA